ncbi:hypothetical protein [Methanofollis fontis]|uniref:Uncharacterized protein n=1 Tax=Methanofollis fontis TaxID=2052832 RepID=A0A483CLJ0_9EURY|nr:hypothetical protein [Methanofollis fontis]TAJ43334.1 hypothetical protein CUJ86_11310 [Methanofollis fontis]
MMRRIYYRFPARFDLNFTLSSPFRGVLGGVAALHRSHTTRRKDGDLFKHDVLIDVADDRTHFLPLDMLSGSLGDVTESVDFRMAIHETLLRAEGRRPISENRFLFRVVDRGDRTEVFVVKEGTGGAMDAMHVKEMLKGACE